MTDLEKKSQPAELDDDALEMISGGENTVLLKPIMTAYTAICSCGYQETVGHLRIGKVVCPQCTQTITNYKEVTCSR